MQIRLDTRDIQLPGNAASRLTPRIAKVFSRLQSRVQRLHVVLKDVNGPRGGQDKVCVLRAELTDGKEVVVLDKSDTTYRALFRCLRRGRVLVARHDKRRLARNRRAARLRAFRGAYAGSAA